MSFKRFDPEDIVINVDTVTTSAWSNNNPVLTQFFTSSTQYASSTRDFYLNVYNIDPDANTGEQIQFTIGYANKTGAGTEKYSGTEDATPSRTLYGQVRNLILGTEETNFKFGSGDNEHEPDGVYVITLDRGRYKEKLLPGSISLELSGSGGEGITITDTSATTSTISYTDAGRVFELTSNISSSVAGSGSYGRIYPDIGVILLNQDALDAREEDGGIGLGTGTGTDTDEENGKKLFYAIESGSSFTIRAQESVSSNLVFARVRNNEFNYTTNPSILDVNGSISQSILIDNPESYITSVGLYNDNLDLLAVAKLSRPLRKGFSKEALIRIKLDY